MGLWFAWLTAVRSVMTLPGKGLNVLFTLLFVFLKPGFASLEGRLLSVGIAQLVGGLLSIGKNASVLA